MKVNSSNVAGPAQPAINSTASTSTTAACTSSAPTIKRRRSVVSASTPAGSDNTNIGMNTAVCTKAARNDEPVSSTISHDAAMVCIALARKYTRLASHRLRNPRWRSVTQIDGWAGRLASGGGVPGFGSMNPALSARPNATPAD